VWEKCSRHFDGAEHPERRVSKRQAQRERADS
jgi:hypothetical protein